MKSIRLYLVFVFLGAGMMACSSGIDTDPSVFNFQPGDNQKVRPIAPKDLTGLSSIELIETKYNQFDLSCKMWTQKGLGLNTNLAPNDDFIWAVLDIYNQSAQLILQSVLENYQVDVQIKIDDILHLTDHILKSKDHTQYNLTHTPEVTLTYHYSGKTLQNNQVTIESTHEGRLPILEKVNYQLVNQTHTSATDSNVKYLTKVDCIVLSEIKEPYKNQFEMKK